LKNKRKLDIKNQSNYEDVVSAGRGDFKRAARAALADHVGHVRSGGGRGLAELGCCDRVEPGVRRAGQMRAQRRQIGGAVDIDTGHERCLGRTCSR